MKTIVVISDMHLDHLETPHYSYKLVKKFIEDTKPSELYINGDALDFGYLSLYTADYPLLRENKRLVKDFDMMNRELDFFQTYCKKVVYIEGNHENRLMRFQEHLPAVADGLVDIEHNLDLKKRKILWYPIDKVCFIFPDLIVTHGTRFGVNFTKNVLEEMQVNTIVGHTHREQMFAKSYEVIKREVRVYGLGCLCDKNPSYQKGKQSGHTNGFGIIEGTEKCWSFYPISIKPEGFSWNGHHYK